MGEGCLKRHFPRIFNITQFKEMTVEEAYQAVNDRIVWSINVIRNLNDWEVAEYEGLMKMLAGQVVDRLYVDQIV